MSIYATHTRADILLWVKATLKAGEALAFFILEDDGSKNLSHQIEMRGSFFMVTGMQGQLIGRFATFAAASRAGLAASAEALQHGQL